MKICNCMITKGKDSEKGSWCVDCGLKIFDVETKMCNNCIYYNNYICKKHLMYVTPTMHVTYRISKGTCFINKDNKNDSI